MSHAVVTGRLAPFRFGNVVMLTSPEKIGVVRDDNQRDDNLTYVAARG